MKERIINEIIRVEGGYVNDPSDSGGETNFGITVAVARANGYVGCMLDLPRSVAFDIYSQWPDSSAMWVLCEICRVVPLSIYIRLNTGTL